MKLGRTAALLAGLSLGASVAMAQAPMDGGRMVMAKNAEAGAKEKHSASATVWKLDQQKGFVTLAHGPVPSLNWPAMTMSFKVKDKKLLPKLAEGRKVAVEFTKQGDDYVVTSVK